MRVLKIISISCAVLLGFSLTGYGYDIVQVTNTPEVNERDYSIAIFGNTVYAVWVGNSPSGGGGELYFDKSMDLGKIWGQQQKILKTYVDGFHSSKILISKTGKIFILYSAVIGSDFWDGESKRCYLLSSEDGGENFYDVAEFSAPTTPRYDDIVNYDFTINETGEIIYVIARGRSSLPGTNYTRNVYIWKSLDGGNTFSEPRIIFSVWGAWKINIETNQNGNNLYFFLGTYGARHRVNFTKSMDYGETFEPLKYVYALNQYAWEVPEDSAIDDNENLYISWSYKGGWNQPDNIMFSETRDRGENFSLSHQYINNSADAYGSSICVDDAGNVYSAFMKDMYQEETFIGNGLYFDKRIGTGTFGVDKYITGPFLTSFKPHIVVTPDGKTAFIMWNNATVAGASSDLYCTTFATNPPPYFNPPIGNREINEGSLLDFTVSATDDDGDAITYSASNLPQGAIFNTQTNKFTWTPDYNQAGIYENIKFTVSDGVNTTEETITITVNNTNRSPVINSIGNKTVNEGVLLQFTVSATDPDSDTITYSMLNAPKGATINSQTGQFSWTPNYNQAGSYIITFVASDGDLSAGETITLKVDNVPIMPTLNPIGNKQVNKGALLEFTVSVAGPDADRVLYAVYLAGDLNHDNALAPMDVLRIISTLNKYGADITPTRPGWNPEMDLTNDGHITSRDVLIAINMLNKGMTTKPSGVSIDSKTGRFSWRPTAAQVGAHRLTFVASDGSLSDAETIIITVKNGALLRRRIKGVRI